jgi:hypothetical protein
MLGPSVGAQPRSGTPHEPKIGFGHQRGIAGSTRSAMRVPVRAVRRPSISPGVANQKPNIRAATPTDLAWKVTAGAGSSARRTGHRPRRCKRIRCR